MALIEVYISNGLPNESIVVKNGESHPVELTTEELLNLNNSISELQVQDVSNCGWLIINDISAGIYLKQPDINDDITRYDKGGNIDKNNSAYESLNNLVTSLVNRI